MLKKEKGESKMNILMRSLASENFYATTDALRAFFAFGMEEPSAYEQEKKKVISSYGDEYVTILIEGLMLRERSWMTERGFATSTEEVMDEVAKALSSGKKVKLQINTGGGIVSGTTNLVNLISKNRDKIEAYATGMVASAGMWVFSAAGKRYAEDTTILGSIGVVTSVFEDKDYWKNYGIVWEEIVSENAENKRPDVTKESGKAEIRRYLTSLEAIFIDSVSDLLGMSREDIISKFNKGGLVTGKEAFDFRAISGIINGTENIRTLNKTKESSMQDEKLLAELQEKLATSEANIVSLNEKKDGIIAGLEKQIKDESEKAEKALSDLKATTKEIIGMAYEHGVDHETTVKMVEKGTVEGAGLIALEHKKTEGASANGGDLDGNSADAEAKAKAKAEMAYALECAKKLSVKRGE